MTLRSYKSQQKRFKKVLRRCSQTCWWSHSHSSHWTISPCQWPLWLKKEGKVSSVNSPTSAAWDKTSSWKQVKSVMGCINNLYGHGKKHMLARPESALIQQAKMLPYPLVWTQWRPRWQSLRWTCCWWLMLLIQSTRRYSPLSFQTPSSLMKKWRPLLPCRGRAAL